MSLETYIDLDLSRNGEASTQLSNGLEREARFDEIPLTTEHAASASNPPFMTREMARWYRNQIAGERVRALGELEARFNGIQSRRGVEAFFLEAEMDRLTQEKWNSTLLEFDQFNNSNEVMRLAADLEDKRANYEQKRAANGGEGSHAWNPVAYMLLLFIIAIPELFLNLESMLRTMQMLGLTSPALAIGLTVAVMVGIAMSSHIIGISIHQWGDRFGGHVSRTEKWRHARFFSTGWILFSVSISIVAYGRFLLFSDDLERALLTGRTTNTGAVIQIAYTVGGNVLIWLLGIVFSMLAHDKVDGLGEAKREYDQAERRYDARYKTDLADRKAKHLSIEQKKKANIRDLEKKELQPMHEYAQVRRFVEALIAKDNDVLGVLDNYRLNLIGAIDDTGTKTRFRLDDIANAEAKGVRYLTSSQYSSIQLTLPYA